MIVCRWTASSVFTINAEDEGEGEKKSCKHKTAEELEKK